MPSGGTKRRIGRRKGRVSASNSGPTGEYGFTQDSTACTISAKIMMYSVERTRSRSASTTMAPAPIPGAELKSMPAIR